MRIDIITIFPEYFGPLGVSLIGKAAQRGDIIFGVHDLRDWTDDVHKTVDDAPFGGGPGMVMKPEPWARALDHIAGSPAAPAGEPAMSVEAGATARARTGAAAAGPVLVVPTPAGQVFTQAMAAELARARHLIFACGRYEGIDARVADYARAKMAVLEVTIGDYVLAGGEAAALVMIEAMCRLLPGVLGNAESAKDDSFGAGTGPMSGLVEGPAYTRPRQWRGLDVPPVLLSGDHGAVARWRRDQALMRTARNRPDLIAGLGDTELGLRDRQVLSQAGFAISGEDMAH